MTQADALSRRLARNRLTRRDTLWLFGASVGASILQGCATSPVTGQQILVGMSPQEEIEVDRRQSPHQFSQDLGAVQDAEVNAYVEEVSRRLQAQVHRRDMPYSTRVLGANYVNAYTFPAGAMGITRGIVTQLGDEAELSALIGHEMGHVNARHAAQRQGQAMVAQAAMVAVAVAAAASNSRWGSLAGVGGVIGASALLASYSRDNEREADALGQEYMVKAGYPAAGMTRLHQLLVSAEGAEPGLLQTMFASHPMSGERRDTARRRAETTYAASAGAPAGRERFMDRTAALRRLKPTIDACQRGEVAMSRKAVAQAQREFETALRATPRDYPANLRMAQCLAAQDRLQEARRYVDTARQVYPQEAQAAKLGASLKLGLRDPAGAYEDLQAYDRLLPGDPGTRFLKGFSLEGMGRQPDAAREYAGFLQTGAQGQAANYAQGRLKAWGYLK